MQIIPFKEPSQWQEQIELGSQTFVLSFSWNAMNEYWVMDILTRDLVPIILGIKVVANYDLTAQYVQMASRTAISSAKISSVAREKFNDTTWEMWLN